MTGHELAKNGLLFGGAEHTHVLVAGREHIKRGDLLAHSIKAVWPKSPTDRPSEPDCLLRFPLRGKAVAEFFGCFECRHKWKDDQLAKI